MTKRARPIHADVHGGGERPASTPPAIVPGAGALAAELAADLNRAGGLCPGGEGGGYPPSLPIRFRDLSRLVRRARGERAAGRR